MKPYVSLKVSLEGLSFARRKDCEEFGRINEGFTSVLQGAGWQELLMVERVSTIK